MTWPEEIPKWRDDLTWALAAGTAEEHKAALDAKADITIIGRDNLKDIKLRHAKRFNTLIFDEASGAKSHRSARYKITRAIVEQGEIQHVWELSGTPSPNGLHDLWSQFAILDGGERLGKNITTFRNRYFYPGLKAPNSNAVIRWDLKPEAEERIYEKIEDIALGMTAKYYLELPPITYNDVQVNLPSSVKKMYNEFRKNLVADMSILGGEIHTAANAAVLTNKLSQIAAGGLYVDDADLRDGKYQWIHDAKQDALEEIMEGTGSSILCFYNFKFEREKLMERFPFAMQINDVGMLKKWDTGKIKLLIAHPASASMGLNLQHGGHTIVWLTPTWNQEHYEQGNKRVLRQGQENPVIVHHLLASPVCRAQVDRVQNKTSVQDALKAALESVL